LLSIEKWNSTDLLEVILNWVCGRTCGDNGLGRKVILFGGSK
jgi:hypothetical protein